MFWFNLFVFLFLFFILSLLLDNHVFSTIIFPHFRHHSLVSLWNSLVHCSTSIALNVASNMWCYCSIQAMRSIRKSNHLDNLFMLFKTMQVHSYCFDIAFVIADIVLHCNIIGVRSLKTENVTWNWMAIARNFTFAVKLQVIMRRKKHLRI